jgi:phosphohistidine phosphatase SixA
MMSTLKAVFFALALAISLQAAPAIAVDALQNGNIILFRHANAPGVGDPPNFQLNDCATQRNLDEVGRLQAKRIGDYLRAQNVKVDRVITSQWCRCKDTASNAFPELTGASIQADAVFNSFFNERKEEPQQTAAAKNLLLAWRGAGYLVVVTHQVNITALTNIFPQSGEGIVLRRDGKQLKVVGRINP